eukprot:CAMPEP_0183555886 /NCGR_PEP_ID=MMETSP0371-20130417/80870_1 /TAXON_ID=268820 /ORGANISM="Peridinium aciculiferum, Strain PAER-2" /LENGTH=142 /DNA_ID=CAMNT_0025762261 /DNA_START=34 /DNA_END=459 /DNA_ORIENTATION=-
MAAAGRASPKQAIGAARTQIANVSDELREVKQSLMLARSSVAFETAAAVTQAIRYARESSGGVQPPGLTPFEGDRDELERQLRHAHVERDTQRSRAERLQEERDALLGAQVFMEAQLKSLRRQLDDASLQLRHRDLDLRLGG